MCAWKLAAAPSIQYTGQNDVEAPYESSESFGLGLQDFNRRTLRPLRPYAREPYRPQIASSQHPRRIETIATFETETSGAARIRLFGASAQCQTGTNVVRTEAQPRLSQYVCQCLVVLVCPDEDERSAVGEFRAKGPHARGASRCEARAQRGARSSTRIFSSPRSRRRKTSAPSGLR